MPTADEYRSAAHTFRRHGAKVGDAVGDHRRDHRSDPLVGPAADSHAAARDTIADELERAGDALLALATICDNRATICDEYTRELAAWQGRRHAKGRGRRPVPPTPWVDA